MITKFKIFESKAETVKIEFSSELLSIIDVNMYNSSLDSDEVLSSELSELSEETKELFWDIYDNNKYKTFILNQAKIFVNEKVKPLLINLTSIKNLPLGIVDIIVDSIYSPAAYNYGGDLLYYDLIVYKNFDKILLIKLDEIIKDNKEKLITFLKKYESRSGFISYMPSNIIELQEYLNKEHSHYIQGISAMLNYLIGDEKLKELQENFIESVEYDENGNRNENIPNLLDLVETKDKIKYNKLKKSLYGK